MPGTEGVSDLKAFINFQSSIPISIFNLFDPPCSQARRAFLIPWLSSIFNPQSQLNLNVILDLNSNSILDPNPNLDLYITV